MTRSSLFMLSFIASIYQERVICETTNLNKNGIKFPDLESESWHEKSDGCKSPCGNNEWLSWEQWSSCNIPIAGNPDNKPRCYNSLQNRRRSCSLTNSTCKEFNWQLCLHKESCTGQWSQWTTFEGNCSEDCTSQTRNRTCMKDGEIAYGLCYPSSYKLGIDIETEVREVVYHQHIQVCSESECNSNALIYALTFGIRGLLFIATIALAVWVQKRCSNDKQKNGPRNKAESTYRHYSFAVDSNDLQMANSIENVYEETCDQPSVSDIPPYASAAELQRHPVNDDVYETPLPSTSLKFPRNSDFSSTALSRSRSVDGMIANHTKLYEDIEEQSYVGSTGYTLLGQESLPIRHSHSQLPTTTTVICNKESDDDIYTPMNSPTTTDAM